MLLGLQNKDLCSQNLGPVPLAAGLAAQRGLNSMPHPLGTPCARLLSHSTFTTATHAEATLLHRGWHSSPQREGACSGPHSMEVEKQGGTQAWLAPGPLLTLIHTKACAGKRFPTSLGQRPQ